MNSKTTGLVQQLKCPPEIFRPLTHPSELANNPHLSQPFLDSALPDMVKTTEEKLRQERANLWRAKNLNRRFIGDESWMPLELVESQDDWDMFEPRQNVPGEQLSKKRKRDEDQMDLLRNGVNGQDHAQSGHNEHRRSPGGEHINGNGDLPNPLENAALEPPKADNRQYTEEQPKTTDSRDESATTTKDVDMADADEARMNGEHVMEDAQDFAADPDDNPPDTNGTTAAKEDPEHHSPHNEDDNASKPENTNASDTGTPPPPTRRITRALAAADAPSRTTTPPLSPTSSISSLSSTLLTVDPLFLLPPSLAQSRPHHPTSLLLPIDELLETRRLLTMYIQKQEESVRGYEAVLGKLIKAKRMRERVWEWCKAEGHVGEWSDGEDWIDSQAWGVAEGELRKGKDEEENVEEETGRKGRKGRRRE